MDGRDDARTRDCRQGPCRRIIQCDRKRPFTTRASRSVKGIRGNRYLAPGGGRFAAAEAKTAPWDGANAS
ncbi:hypothetical protein Thpro_023116 [Acidihalobacter prosperus]|uniref:Uncharacterized protein n=1 Tax=Acidihalobacter prosperus TaxID=160660 RepID=A0A1A6C2S9_9GAMM|nr:hypothetical protein Thpro_023116 [Acidihalobacter prosperus]